MTKPPRLDGSLLGVPKGAAKAAPIPVDTTPRTARVAFTLRLDGPLHDALRLAAFEQRRPMHDIVIEVLSDRLGVTKA